MPISSQVGDRSRLQRNLQIYDKYVVYKNNKPNYSDSTDCTR